MEIRLKREPDPSLTECFQPVEVENYFIESVLKTDEDATAVDVAKMLVKAMEIDGYQPMSIAQALLDVALYMSYEEDEKLLIYEDDMDCLESREWAENT